MYKEFFSNMETATLPLAALAIFVTFFVLVVARTLVVKPKRELDTDASLPFNDGTHPSQEIQP
jgi:hypothetical protein